MENTPVPGDELHWCLKETSDGVSIEVLYERLAKQQLIEGEINKALTTALEQGTVRLPYVAGKLRLWLSEEKPLPTKQPGLSNKIAWFVHSKGPTWPNLLEVFDYFYHRMGLQADIIAASIAELIAEKVLLVSSSLRQSKIETMLVRAWQYTVIATDRNARTRILHVRAGTRDIAEQKVRRAFSSISIVAICDGAVSPWASEGGAPLDTEVL